MNILDFTDLFTEAAEKVGLSREKGIALAMFFWNDIQEKDIKPEVKPLLEAGICPDCGSVGWIVSISDHSLDDYQCMSCGSQFFVIDELEGTEI